MSVATPTVSVENPPLNLDVTEAAYKIGCSRSTVYELMAAGELASFKLGRRRLVPYASCVALSERLAASGAS
jgi:excisionase family DNA binding protein